MNDWRPVIPMLQGTVVTRDGERIHYGEWPGTGPATFIAIHGLTNQHRNFAGVAARLDPAITVLAPDLRGRGASTRPGPGRYGIAQHARDVLDLMDSLGIEHAVVGGHSMGAYVATQLAVAAPDRIQGVVLVDGGVWIEEDRAQAQEVERLVDVVVQRLHRKFTDVEEYLSHWADYPQFSGGLEPVAVANLHYDIERTPDGYAAKCSIIAAREDLKDCLRADENTEAILTALPCSALAIGAEFGILNSLRPVLGPAHFDYLHANVPESRSLVVEGTDHHTIVLSDHGSAACAEAIGAFMATF